MRFTIRRAMEAVALVALALAGWLWTVEMGKERLRRLEQASKHYQFLKGFSIEANLARKVLAT